MDLNLLRAFQFQIAVQCRFIILGAEGLLRVEDRDRLWFSIQSILAAAANLSKAFWGPSGKLAEERQTLRWSLGVSDTSPLKPTVMRNHWEHLDDRLDDWHSKTPTHNFADCIVEEDVSAWSPIDVFRQYDPATGQVRFWDDEFDLAGILLEAKTILPRAESESRRNP